MKLNQSILFLIGWLILAGISCNTHPDLSDKKIRETEIEDFLLQKLYQYKILVIPECLSHDSYDAIRLPLNLIKRWLQTDYKIKKLFVGLETEANSHEFELIQQNRYYQFQRFATFCPPGWGLFSTKRLNEYLFYKEVLDKAPGRFRIFGFENNFHYYDKANNKYLLPSQLNTISTEVDSIAYSESKAPFIIKYIYSRFFRDYMAYQTIQRMIQKNPDACFLIIIGNAHTLKKFNLTNVDRQILDIYKINKNKYFHSVGYFLKQNYDPLFVQSNIDSTIRKETLFQFDPATAYTVKYKFFNSFYTDFIYSLPQREDTNSEEQPIVCLPSARNFALLKSKNFQIYPESMYIAIAKKMIYFMTGIVPEVKLDEPGKTAACTFIDPAKNKPLDFEKFEEKLPQWYLDGTFVKRLNEDVPAYHNRLLFKAIFQMMGKSDLSPLSDQEAKLFTDYLLALLSVVGTEGEQAFARGQLSKQFGNSEDYYYYYKKFYYGKYSMD